MLPAPPKEERGYLNAFTWVRQSSEAEFRYTIYDLRDPSNRYVFTALVLLDDGVRANYSKEDCIALSLVYPISKWPYKIRTTSYIALVYPRLIRLGKYLENPKRLLEEGFRSVMKGILNGLCNVQQMYMERKIIINDDTLVINEDGVGSLLLIFEKEEGERDRQARCDDFIAIKNAVTAPRQRMREGDPLAPPNEIVLPEGLQSLLDCIPLAKSNEQRRRLLRAPYLLQEYEIYSYVETLFSAVNSCKWFKEELRSNKVVDIVAKVESNDEYPEVERFWTDGVSQEIQLSIKNEYDLCRFLRNALVHINEKWMALGNSGASRILEDTKVLLEFMDTLYPGFLNVIFKRSYSVSRYVEKGGRQIEETVDSIPLLDLKQDEEKHTYPEFKAMHY